MFFYNFFENAFFARWANECAVWGRWEGYSLHEVLEVDVQGGPVAVVHAFELLDVIAVGRPILTDRHPTTVFALI